MKNKRFIEQSILGALSFLKGSLFADACAGRRGFLQARDPRIKTLAILALLLSALFSHSIPFIACVYVLCLGLAVLSSIGLVFFLKRTWFFIPLFSFCVAVPALFDAFTPGEALFSIKFFALTLTVTRQGAASAGIFLMRVATSVSLCVLLGLTTRHTVLLKVLRSFGVGHLFVMTVGMCYRYVYLFIEMVQNTYVAVKSRAGHVVSSGAGRRLVAWNIACLWRRSYEMHRRVYDAMVSRGYDGEPRTMETFRAGAADMLWLGAALAVLAGSLWQTHFLN